MKISSQFPTTLDSPEHIAIAERLGYAHAWLFDTPQQSADVWMILALAAQRTERIGVGPSIREAVERVMREDHDEAVSMLGAHARPVTRPER